MTYFKSLSAWNPVESLWHHFWVFVAQVNFHAGFCVSAVNTIETLVLSNFMPGQVMLKNQNITFKQKTKGYL